MMMIKDLIGLFNKIALTIINICISFCNCLEFIVTIHFVDLFFIIKTTSFSMAVLMRFSVLRPLSFSWALVRKRAVKKKKKKKAD